MIERVKCAMNAINIHNIFCRPHYIVSFTIINLFLLYTRAKTNIDRMGANSTHSTIYKQAHQLLEFSEFVYNFKYQNLMNKIKVLAKVINGILSTIHRKSILWSVCVRLAPEFQF